MAGNTGYAIASQHSHDRAAYPRNAPGGTGSTRPQAVILTHLRAKYILQHMKPLLVEVDDDLARRLDQVAPARTRRRSEFIRRAIMVALWKIEEQATAEAYARQPDGHHMAFDPTVWDAPGSEDDL